MKPLQVHDSPERVHDAQPQSPEAVDRESTGGLSTDILSERPMPCGPRDRRSPLQASFEISRRQLLACTDLKSVQTAAIAHLNRTCRPALMVWYHPGGTQIGSTDRLEGLQCPTDGLSDALKGQLKTIATDANRRGEVCTSDVGPGMKLYGLPLTAVPGHCLLLIADHTDTSAPLESELIASLLMFSSFVNEWSVQQTSAVALDNARTVAAMIELVAHVHSATNVDAACQRLVDSLQQYLHADKVVIGLCRGGLSDVGLRAISGGAVIDAYSEETRLIESVLQESLVRSTSGVWPVIDPGNRHALLSHQQLAESGFGETLVSMPILSESGTPVGSILAVLSASEKNTHLQQAQATERFLRAGAAPFAGCLGVLQKLADSRWLRLIERTRSLFSTSRLQIAAWIFGAVAMILLLPMTYRIRCSLELQPVERNYVAAPFDGPLEECLVEPGDVVVKDQILARMDGREIRWELAEIEANLNKATKERNTQLSKKEFGNAAISGHEMQRLEQRSALLTHRSASLEIRSPANGVVVSGDHREAEGVPLETGKTLFEIAPLNIMVVELAVPEADVRHVTIGMEIELQLEAMPERTIHAVIRSIHPRAELRDGENVFIAEADVANDDLTMLPGMRGTARIHADRHTIGWNLFHKPTAWLLGWLGW